MIAIPPWLTLRLAATFVIALGLFAIGWKAGATLTEARWQRVQVKAERDHTAALARAREAERASYAKAQEVSHGYQEELRRLRERRVSRDPVRLCVNAAPAARVPATRAALGGSGSTASAGRLVQSTDRTDLDVRPGPDIGSALRGVGRRADEVAAQARGLQQKAL